MLKQRQARAAVFAASLFVSCDATAFAQAQQRERSTWEIEGHGGLSIAVRPGSGTVVLPEPGAPITSTSPIFPARRAPSWFFGDGALMLNQALEALDVDTRLTPLDDALSSFGSAGTTGASFGVRVRRGLASRVDAEFGLEVMRGSARLPDELVVAADAARISFEQAFGGLFDSGPFSGTDIIARTSTTGGSGRELALTGAINIRLAPDAALSPYVTLGGGMIDGIGDGPSLTLEGRYRTTIDRPRIPELPGIPIDETDQITLRYAHGRAYVAVAGAGVRRDFGGAWGLRVDGRVLIGRDNTRLLIDAAPVIARGTPVGFIETFTHPNLQFSNDPSTGRESSLGGGLDGFEAFKGTGITTRFLITVGIVRRF